MSASYLRKEAPKPVASDDEGAAETRQSDVRDLTARWRPREQLCVIESGAATFDPTARETFDSTLTVTQPRNEAPLSFAQRVVARIETNERMLRWFASATLFVNASYDPAVCSARRTIALAIAAHAQCQGMAELVVVAFTPCAAEQRTALLALANELMVGPHRLPVRIRFG